MNVTKKKKNNLGKRGFTLLEIMLVVGILAIIATIAIPGLIRTRVSTYEKLAMHNIKVLITACYTYHTNIGDYPVNLKALGDEVPAYVDTKLASGDKQYYHFTVNQLGEGFEIHADPIGFLATYNAKYYYADDTGMLRWNPAGDAGPLDDEIN